MPQKHIIQNGRLIFAFFLGCLLFNYPVLSIFSQTRFVLTEQSIEKLQEADVPRAVIERLRVYKDQEFSDEDDFWTTVEESLKQNISPSPTGNLLTRTIPPSIKEARQRFEQNAISGLKFLDRAEVYAKKHFTISAELLSELGEKNISDETLQELASFKDTTCSSQSEFLGMIGSFIGEDLLARYHSLLLDYSEERLLYRELIFYVLRKQLRQHQGLIQEYALTQERISRNIPSVFIYVTLAWGVMIAVILVLLAYSRYHEYEYPELSVPPSSEGND